MLLWRKILEDEHCLSQLISYVKPIEKYIAFEPRTETKCQLHSQSKLTLIRRENRNIRHENVTLKANEHAPHV
jgi:hypothetical protein